MHHILDQILPTLIADVGAGPSSDYLKLVIKKQRNIFRACIKRVSKIFEYPEPKNVYDFKFMVMKDLILQDKQIISSC